MDKTTECPICSATLDVFQPPESAEIWASCANCKHDFVWNGEWMFVNLNDGTIHKVRDGGKSE